MMMPFNCSYRNKNEEGGGVRSGPGAARTILLFHTISARPSKQPRMVGSTLGVYSFGLIFVSARTNKRHHHLSTLHPYSHAGCVVVPQIGQNSKNWILAKPAKTKTQKCRFYFNLAKAVRNRKVPYPNIFRTRSRRSVLCPP